MIIFGEQKRLEIIRDVLRGQSLLNATLPAQLKLAVDAGDADDCAVYDFPGNLSLVVGMDFVRGTGFVLFQENYLNYFDLGYYLIVANLSDIAAMGATPIGLTTVIRYTNSLEDEAFTQIIEGIKAAAQRYETPIVGGDIGGYSEVVLAATAFGITEQGKYLRRQGTIEGDALCITGYAGLAGTALIYFIRAKKEGLELSDAEEQALLTSWKRPAARIAEGLALARLGVVHACQDVSDGVKATIDQLGKASNISFEIRESGLPIHPITLKVATFLKVDPIALAFSASVDFQLMFTVAQKDLNLVRQALQPPGNMLHILGHAIPVAEPSRFVHSDGMISSIPGTAWNQQAENVTKVILEGK